MRYDSYVPPENPYQSLRESTYRSPSTEGYELETERYAGFWVRVFGHLIDILILALIRVILYLAFFYPETDISKLQILKILGSLIDNIYFVYFWTSSSTTPGMKVFKLRIVDSSTGDTITKSQALLRWLGYLACVFTCGLGFLWVAVDRRKRGLHDKIAGTTVIYDKPPNVTL